MCWNLFCVKRRLKKVPRGEVGTLNGTADTSHQVILFQRKALLRGSLGQFRNRCCMCLVGRWFITVPASLGFRFFTNDSIMNWTTRILRHYFWDSTSALELFWGGCVWVHVHLPVCSDAPLWAGVWTQLPLCMWGPQKNVCYPSDVVRLLSDRVFYWPLAHQVC